MDKHSERLPKRQRKDEGEIQIENVESSETERKKKYAPTGHSAAVPYENIFENSASGSQFFLKRFFAQISNLKSDLKKSLRVFLY